MKSGTFVFEKGKTDGILNGVQFRLWELLHIIDSSYNKGSKQLIYKHDIIE